MSFNDKSRLDPTQVEDRRGRGRGRTIAVGGGGLGLIIVVVAMLFGVDLTGLTSTDPWAASTIFNAKRRWKQRPAGGMPDRGRCK
ncbi:neutral zinc metallopeptidase [Candidatus Villigracilis affinis]|uniref:neutral zinc metallopeptidase n=1 Tax=Candidatus Villigracilis affinis TaxID=3140682 RepID=UPI0031EA450B